MGLIAVKGLMLVYHALVEPVLAVGLRRSRLAALGAQGELDAVTLCVEKGRGCSPRCDAERPCENAAVRRYLARARRGSDGWALRLLLDADRLRRPTPMIVDLDRHPDMASFEALLRKRSARTLAKARRAREAGYEARVFARQRHAADVQAIRRSKPFRSGGPVIDYFLPRPRATARAKDAPPPPAPKCPRHWTRWWGVFRSAPGHRQGEVATDEELVAFVKLRRIGDMVHYVEIMGHADHLPHNVMVLLHVEIMRWLIARESHAAGVRAVLYGGLEHGREGLLTWKKRAGFAPALLVRAEDGSRSAEEIG